MLKIAATVYVFWVGVLFVYQGHLIFPVHAVPRTAVLAAPPAGAVPIGTSSTEPAVGWLLFPTKTPVGEAPVEKSPPLAVWFHGNAEVIDQIHSSREVQLLRSLGFAVLLVEYPGYGSAPGEPSQESIVRSSLSLIRTATSAHRFDPARVVYVGRSLGGGVACAVAEQQPPKAMILMSTFTSIASFAWGLGVPEFVVRHPFRSDETLAKLDCPVLIMHGDRDDIVPVGHGRQLAKIARRASYVEESGSGHLDFPRDWRVFEAAIRTFVETESLAGD